MDLPFDEDARPDSEPLASKILVVDDEEVVRDVVVRLLSKEADLAVTAVEDGQAALKLLRAEPFELLVTDKNLPGQGGIALIEAAKALDPAIEAVLITGYPSADSVLEAFAAGASDYIVKPFDDVRVVRAKIRAAIGRHVARLRGARELEFAKLARQRLSAHPDEALRTKLDHALDRYEAALREEPKGNVWVASDLALGILQRAGRPAYRCEGPLPHSAELLVLEPQGAWREAIADGHRVGAHVMMLAAQDTELADLLEAISLRVELLDAGERANAMLPERVRAHLLRRSVDRALAQLTAELAHLSAYTG